MESRVRGLEDYGDNRLENNAERRPSKRLRLVILGVLVLCFILLALSVLGLIFISDVVTFILNWSKFDVQVSSLSEIHEEGFKLAFASKVYRTGPVVVQIQPTRLFLRDGNTCLGFCQLSKQMLDGSFGSTAEMNILTDFSITNKEQFSKFLIKVIQNEYVDWRLTANMTLTINLIPGLVLDEIRMDKIVRIPGLNNLRKQIVEKLDLPREVTGGILMKTSNLIHNPSPIGMSAGKAGFKLSYNGTYIGALSVPTLYLKPGINKWELEGHLIPLNSTQMLVVNKFFDDYVHGIDPIITVEGDYISPSNNSIQAQGISWLSTAFTALKMPVMVPAPKDFKPIKSIVIDMLFLDFSGKNMVDAFPAISDISASYSLPFGFPINITELSQNVYLKTKRNEVIGQISFPNTPVVSNHSKKQLIANGMKGSLKVSSTKGFGLLSELLFQIINEKIVSVTIDGEVSSKMKSIQGEMSLTNISIKQSMDIKGLNMLTDPAPTITSVTLISCSPHTGILKQISLSIHNPSTVGANLGTVSFDMMYNNTRIGNATINSLSLLPGSNNVTAIARIDLPPGNALLEGFLSRFITGKRQEIKLIGSQSSTSISFLKPSFSHFSNTVILNGLMIDQVERAYLKRNVFGAFVKFNIYNPFDVSLTITGLSDFKILYNPGNNTELQISSFDKPSFDSPFEIPPKKARLLDFWIPLDEEATLGTYVKIGMQILAASHFNVRSFGYLHILIDEFPAKLFYEQLNIKVYTSMF